MVCYPKNFEEKIGFDRIRELIRQHCLFEPGRRQADKMAFYHDLAEIRPLLRQTEEFLDIVKGPGDFPLQNFIDMEGPLSGIRAEGTFLEAGELHDLRKMLQTVRAILMFFAEEEDVLHPEMAELCRSVKFYPYVTQRIDRILSARGEVRDSASRELAAIRKNKVLKQAEISKKMDRLLKNARNAGYTDRETGMAFRNGRLVIPVNSKYKRSLNGIVHDESATGRTVYIEPAEVVEMNNLLRELEYAEKREIMKILLAAADDIRPYREELLALNDFLAKIDLIRAKALFARQINAIRPLVKNEPVLKWKKAIHPLLKMALGKEGREVVPLDIRLEKKQRMLLISGPNAGGKSVCLQTTGLLQYMLQCGLLVPVDEGSEMGIFNDIFINIGDEQSIENDLSTYSSHLLNMKYFLKNAGQHTLLLIDEFGAGTEPALGGAIAETIFERLSETGAFGVITTHYSNLKHFAAGAEGIGNGAMIFDTEHMKPLYKLAIGQPGSSFAFEIARGIGLPEKILKRATDKAGEEQVSFDRHLKDIIRDKKYWENKRNRIRKAEKKLTDMMQQYESELEKLASGKNTILKQAREEAEELIADANKKIENTIRIIKENLAGKEKTRRARKELEDFRKKQSERETRKENAILDKKLQKVRSRLRQMDKHSAPSPRGRKTAKMKDTIIRTGDHVKIKGQDNIGEVIARKGKKVRVSIGNMITIADAGKLEKISPGEYREMNRGKPARHLLHDWDPGKRKFQFSSELDVRGHRGESALEEVQEFIDEAIVLQESRLRIIHGKGDGILRQLIRQYLEGIDVVADYHDEHIRSGGTGVTVVNLDV